MRAERLFRALGLVDQDLIEEANPTAPQPAPWRRWVTAAACLALACGFVWLASGGFRGLGSSGGSDSGGGTGGSGVEDGTVFMSYSGPVFPLTTVEDSGGLTAERTVTWDFSPGAYADGTPRQWGANVTDAYILSSASDQDITVTALYPFAGSFSELAALRPVVTVDGTAVEATLYAGAYSGGFQSAFGAGAPDTMNLDTLDSWEEYKALLESGGYLAQALGPYPVLDTPVTVYEFSDFAAPHDQYRAATQAISFEMDETATQILTYGINGYERDGSLRRYSYFVPDGMRKEPELKMLVVLGKDIGNYTLQGYQDGGCERGEEIDGVSCTVTRTETTLDALLDRLCRGYVEQYAEGLAVDQENAFDAVSFTMYRGAVAELLTQYGAFSGTPMDRYSDGRLDDILSETLHHDRVLYVAFPVTVPAGDSAAVDCALWKEPSYDYDCSGLENAGLQGYDLVTRLGSSLEFTQQTAALASLEGVTIVAENFGFDMAHGEYTAVLDPAQEHYYLELRPLKES